MIEFLYLTRSTTARAEAITFRSSGARKTLPAGTATSTSAKGAGQ